MVGFVPEVILRDEYGTSVLRDERVFTLKFPCIDLKFCTCLACAEDYRNFLLL